MKKVIRSYWKTKTRVGIPHITDQIIIDISILADEERVFLVSEELEFRTGETEGDPTFVWRDLQGDVDELYEYVATGTNEPTKAFFEICMYRAMYERKYKTSAADIPDSRLEEFIWKYENGHGTTSSCLTFSSRQPSGRVVPQRTASKEQFISERATVPSNLDTLLSSEAELYFWDLDKNEFAHQGIVTANILQLKGAYQFWIAATVDEKPILAHEITANMNQRFSTKLLSITWNYIAGDECSSWLFRFTDKEAYDSFYTAFGQCLWQNVNQEPWEKVKVKTFLSPCTSPNSWFSPTNEVITSVHSKTRM